MGCGRFRNIVDEEHIASADITHNIDGFHICGARALFRHQPKAGPEHVGLGSDFDGVPCVPEGWNCTP